jgi:hypothetical protein
VCKCVLYCAVLYCTVLYYCNRVSTQLQLKMYHFISYLRIDKQQDGGSTDVCFRFLFLMIMNGWICQVKYFTVVNCNRFTHNIQINTSIKLFTLYEFLILSVPLLCIRSKYKEINQFIFPGWLSPYTHSDQSYGWFMEESTLECREG